MDQIRPLIISPYFFKQNNANGIVDRALFLNLPNNFLPTILTTDFIIDKSLNNSCETIIVKDSKIVNNLFKFVKHTPFREVAYSPDLYYFSWLKKVKKAIRVIPINNYSY